ncbi:MAG: class F sortase [Candidatus Doudnabacteria bacterium]|nr:class F sortase [Candidatus Doudnabacteria bacterium]
MPSKSRAFNSAQKVFVGLFVLGVILLVQRFFQTHRQLIPTLGTLTNNDFQPKPARIRIPSLKVDAPVVELGLNQDQTLEVPKNSTDVGWYKYSPAPGGKGPAIMVGHLDSTRGAAVFYRLKDLKTGDMVELEREDHSIAVFRVDSKEEYSQDNFPTDKVYGAIDHAGIRLITCTGTYSILKGRYSDNLVVYGTLVDIRKF